MAHTQVWDLCFIIHRSPVQQSFHRCFPVVVEVLIFFSPSLILCVFWLNLVLNYMIELLVWISLETWNENWGRFLSKCILPFPPRLPCPGCLGCPVSSTTLTLEQQEVASWAVSKLQGEECGQPKLAVTDFTSQVTLSYPPTPSINLHCGFFWLATVHF